MPRLDAFGDRILSGGRLAAAEALRLYRTAPTPLLGRLADAVRRAQASRAASSPTSSTATSTTPTSAWRAATSARSTARSGDAEGYVLGFDEIFQKIDETHRARRRAAAAAGRPQSRPADRSGTRTCSARSRQRYPDFKLHALSPPEVLHISRLSQLPVPRGARAADRRRPRQRARRRRRDPGRPRPQAAATATARRRADEWLDVMRHAHRAGLRTTATMMYGTVETDEERLEHLLRLRDAAGRDRRLHRVHLLELPARAHRARRRRGDRHRLPAHAGGRAARPRQLRQPPGVVGHAGRQGRPVEPGLRRQRHGQRDDRGERRPRRRRRATAWTKSRSSATSRTPASWPSAATCTTSMLGDPIFREREVPRMLELATARADGRSRRCRRNWSNYPARSPAGKQQRVAAAAPSPVVTPPMERRAARARRVGLPDRSSRRSATAGWTSTTAGSPRVGPAEPTRRRPPARSDLGRVVLLPGLVNAHTHLELS